MQDLWKNVQKIQFHNHEFQQIKILMNYDSLIFVTNSSGDIAVIDYQKKSIVQQFKAYEDYISCAAYHKKTQQFAVGGYNNSVSLFHRIDNQFILKKNSGVQHFDNISQIYFLNKGTQLITSSYDQSIYLWDSNDLAIIKVIDQIKGKIKDMSICKKLLLTTITQDGVVCLYNVKNLKNITNHNKVKEKYEEVIGTNVKFMNNKQIQVQADDKIRFIRFQNSKILRSFQSEQYEECSRILFAKNDKYLIAISYNVRVYEIATGIKVDSIITTLHSKIFYQSKQQNLLFSHDPFKGEIEIIELDQ